MQGFHKAGSGCFVSTVENDWRNWRQQEGSLVKMFFKPVRKRDETLFQRSLITVCKQNEASEQCREFLSLTSRERSSKAMPFFFPSSTTRSPDSLQQQIILCLNTCSNGTTTHCHPVKPFLKVGHTKFNWDVIRGFLQKKYHIAFQSFAAEIAFFSQIG